MVSPTGLAPVIEADGLFPPALAPRLLSRRILHPVYRTMSVIARHSWCRSNRARIHTYSGKVLDVSNWETDKLLGAPAYLVSLDLGYLLLDEGLTRAIRSGFISLLGVGDGEG